MKQNPEYQSSLQLLGKSGGQKGYDQALRQRKGLTKIAAAKIARAKLPPKIRKANGKNRRGTKKINKGNLVRLRKKLACKGGQARAGNGSSARAIQKKVSQLKRVWAKTGSFPTRREAECKWKISGSVWQRVRAECVPDD